MDAGMIIVGLLILFGIGTILSGLYTVDTAQAAVIQRFGRFVRVAGPGLNFKVPWFEHVAGKVNLRGHQFKIAVENKTMDNVFLNVMVSVHYHLIHIKVYTPSSKL